MTAPKVETPNVVGDLRARMFADGRLGIDGEREHLELQALIAEARDLEARWLARLAFLTRGSRRDRESATARFALKLEKKAS